MSATVTRPEASIGTLPRLLERADRRAIGDRTVLGALALAFAVIVALTWRKWGMPEGDAGAELTTADLIKHGAVAYQDVRYFYGPLGVYALALWFKVFGTSFTAVYAFGLTQTVAILGVFYALSRRWLAPTAAGLTTAVLLAIGFSGTSFNFVVPHTNSGTFGILTLLLMLLALSRDRLILAGASAGLVGLTRPEFLAVAAGALAAFLIAMWRVDGRSAALRAFWRLALPAIAIPVVVLGWFAGHAGTSNLLFKNLWPVDFLRAGIKEEQNWTPFDLPSIFGLVARAAVYCGLLAALVVSAERWPTRRGFARVRSLSPLAAAILAIGLADAALRVTGIFATQRLAIEGEIHHLILGMSWLPALGIGTFVWATVRLARSGQAPLGNSWAVDFALIVAAVGLGLRAYNAFTAEGSYAPYYAAPLVLLLGILHVRVAAARPRARVAVLGALGVVAAGLAGYAVFGLYRHMNSPVHTARGTFLTTAAAAPGIEQAVRQIDADTPPGSAILAAPIDGGLYFMSDRRPALHELSLLRGLLVSRSDQTQAIASIRKQHVRLVLVSARASAHWGSSGFGSGYDAVIGDYLRSTAMTTTVIGTLAHPAQGTFPAEGFTVLRLPG